jgi:hypothetical protein
LAAMGFRLIKYDSSMFVCLDRGVTIRARVAANPHTAGMAARFDAWLANWKTTFLEEIDHRIAVLSANALATQLDEDLDELSSETAVVVPLATGGDEGELFFYYKGQTKGEFNSPRLGKQHRAMGEWVTHMKQSPHPQIVDLGNRIEKKCDEATQAISAAEKAETSSREFRLTGARRQLIDQFNALGKATEGDLKEMPHAHPELNLPNSFSERFLRSGRPVVAPTVEELKRKRDAIQEELSQAQAELDAAEQAEKDEAAEVAKRQQAEDEKKLVAAKAELEQKAKEVADLEAKLKKPPTA